jgi:hypothetical protein
MKTTENKIIDADFQNQITYQAFMQTDKEDTQ